MFEKSSQKHLINNRNTAGLTPLYVTALNGHLNVQFYFDFKHINQIL
jgi:hypothetical protein